MGMMTNGASKRRRESSSKEDPELMDVKTRHGKIYSGDGCTKQNVRRQSVR